MRAHKKKVLFIVILLILMFVFVEACCFFLLSFYHRRPSFVQLSPQQKQLIPQIISGKSMRLRYSKTLGWEPQPLFSNNKYQYNRHGARSNRNYTTNAPKQKHRILCFGDSYTHCDDVTHENTWQNKISKLSSDYEIINFGVSGYGLDQAYLRYLQKKDIYKDSKVVVIGYMTENINRSQNVFRPFYNINTKIPLTKPRFQLVKNKLLLYENPLALMDYNLLLTKPHETILKLGKHDFFFQNQYKSSIFDLLPSVCLIKTLQHIRKFDFYHSSSLDLVCRTFQKFYQDVKNSGAIPVIVIFPNIYDVKNLPTGKYYQPLLTRLQNLKYTYIDIAEAFRHVDHPKKYFASAHYNALGNQIVAEAISAFMKNLFD